MSKSSQLNIRMEYRLYKAIQEVSAAEGMSKTDLVLPILRAAFLPDEDLVFRVTRQVAIPLVGEVREHHELGNVVVWDGGVE